MWSVEPSPKLVSMTKGDGSDTNTITAEVIIQGTATELTKVGIGQDIDTSQPITVCRGACPAIGHQGYQGYQGYQGVTGAPSPKLESK